jgi:hypothetical protein
MSGDIMIPVERLGKKYIIGHQRELNATLRDVLARGARNVWRKAVDIACGRAIITGDRLKEF